MWDERSKSPAASITGLTKAQKKSARSLAGEMGSLRAALKAGDLGAARKHRSRAWDIVGDLPPSTTWKQRQELWQCKILIQDAERRRTLRQDGA